MLFDVGCYACFMISSTPPHNALPMALVNSFDHSFSVYSRLCLLLRLVASRRNDSRGIYGKKRQCVGVVYVGRASVKGTKCQAETLRFILGLAKFDLSLYWFVMTSWSCRSII